MHRPYVHKPREKKFMRKGRGFSLGEIKAAKTTIQHMKQNHLPIDWLRSSTHAENVSILKQYFSKRTTVTKESKPKK